MGLPPLKDDWFSMHDCYIYGNQNAVELLQQYRPLRARTMPELVAEIPDLRQRYAWVSELPVMWARDLDSLSHKPPFFFRLYHSWPGSTTARRKNLGKRALVLSSARS